MGIVELARVKARATDTQDLHAFIFGDPGHGAYAASRHKKQRQKIDPEVLKTY